MCWKITTRFFLREETFIFPSRYRNFRTFTSPQAVQFSCVTVDSSGEVVCAGSLDTFEIFVWSVKTARLTEVCYWLINVQMIEVKRSDVIKNEHTIRYYDFESYFKRHDVFVVFHTLNRNNMHSELIELIFTRLEV